jgi:hypothetical protein
VDGALLLGGIMSSYMESAAQNRDEADVARISGFLVRRLDDVMRGMAASGETPIVTADRLRRMIACGGMAEDEQGRVRTLMDQLLEQVRGTEAEEAAALLNAECGKAVPHRVVARALLVLLEKQAQPEWRELLSRLESALEEEFGCAMRKD